MLCYNLKAWTKDLAATGSEYQLRLDFSSPPGLESFLNARRKNSFKLEDTVNHFIFACTLFRDFVIRDLLADI